MNDTTLLIIDTQVGLIEPAYRGKEVLDNINILLAQARASHTPVIYVQHDGPKGHGLEVATPAWSISPAIAPQEGDLIVHKRAFDAFYDTMLKQKLEAQRIQHDEAVLTAAQRIAYLNEVVNGFASDTHSITVKPTNEVTFS